MTTTKPYPMFRWREMRGEQWRGEWRIIECINFLVYSGHLPPTLLSSPSIYLPFKHNIGPKILGSVMYSQQIS